MTVSLRRLGVLKPNSATHFAGVGLRVKPWSSSRTTVRALPALPALPTSTGLRPPSRNPASRLTLSTRLPRPQVAETARRSNTTGRLNACGPFVAAGSAVGTGASDAASGSWLVPVAGPDFPGELAAEGLPVATGVRLADGEGEGDGVGRSGPASEGIAFPASSIRPKSSPSWSAT